LAQETRAPLGTTFNLATAIEIMEILKKYKAPPFRIITRARPLDSRRFEGGKGRKWRLPPQTTRTAKRAGVKNLQLMTTLLLLLLLSATLFLPALRLALLQRRWSLSLSIGLGKA